MKHNKTWRDYRWDDALDIFRETTRQITDPEYHYELTCSKPVVAERFADHCWRESWKPVA